MFNQITYEDRVEVLAALGGAVLGIVGGYLSGNGWPIMLLWALIGAVVVSGVVYLHRFFRR